MFNNEYTQYMPLPIFELQALLGQPALFVFDCCSAGNVMPFFTDGDPGVASATNHPTVNTTTNTNNNSNNNASSNARWPGGADRRNSRGSGASRVCPL